MHWFFIFFFQLISILRAIFRDEVIAFHKKRIKDESPHVDANGGIIQDGSTDDSVNMENVIQLVNKSVNSIMLRLKNISHYDNIETNKMNALVQAAYNPDNLCRMDPAFHPWV